MYKFFDAMISKIRSSKDHTEDATNLKEQYTKILFTMLQSISFNIPNYDYDLTIEDYAEQHFVSKGFPRDFIQRILPIIKWSSGIAITSYPYTPVEVQRVVAVYTSYVITIDDLTGEMLEDLKGFSTRLFRGETQPNQLLRCLVEFMNEEACPLYGQFARDMMMKATMDFMSACYFEGEQNNKISFPRDAPNFPEYIRIKTGVAEVYSFFLFPSSMYPEDQYLKLFLPAIPGLVRYFNLANDIFSFYKESVVGDEQMNFVYNYASANGISPLQSVRILSATAVETVRQVHGTLSLDPKMQADIDAFFNGYALYHLSQSRYRLTELDIPEAHEAVRLMRKLKEKVTLKQLR